ncbi:ABC transporter ATP-binding protein/permease [Alphaproteobacteria bacterium]|nr:ABC transporter ATP-binding protein/permease [Alphaproteobacteria bacterium]
MLLTLVGALFEAAGVGLVVPFIAIVTSDNFQVPISFANTFPFLAASSPEEIIILAIASFIVFYFIKSVFLLFLAGLQAGYYFRLQESVSTRLFNSYLAKPYTFHLQNNSGKLLSNTITESMQFAVGFTAPALLFFNDLLITTMILMVLLYIEPVGAIVAFITFGSLSLLLFKASKKRAALWGETRQEKERLRIESAQQGFGGIKDIKLYGRENVFQDRYLKETYISLEAGRKQTILQNVPRVFLEFVTVATLCSLVAIITLAGDKSNITTIVGLFAAAAFKLLPTIARMVQSAQAMVFNSPVVSFMYVELLKNKNYFSIAESAMPLDSHVNFRKKLSIRDLCFVYDGVDSPALDAINLDIEVGSMIGFIGASGAGKSTLIDCLLGLIQPLSGEVKVDGKLITSGNVSSWQKQIGYVSQVIYLLDGSLRDNIAFGISSDSIEEENVRSAVERSQLTEFIASLPDGLDTKVGERGVRLSGGQRQRIGIARALYNNPAVLVLDEATSSLDIITEREVMQSLEELQGSTTVLIIAHRYSTIENCDYLYKLDKGKIVAQGRPSTILGI